MNQINNCMAVNSPQEIYENPAMTHNMSPEMISNNPNESSPQVPHDMPPETALKPEEMSDVVYVDYGQNAFPDGNMQNQMMSQMNQSTPTKILSPQMMSQMSPSQNNGTGDQKTMQQMPSQPTPTYYPQQIMMPQNMAIPHVQMGDGKSMEIMSSMPQSQNMPTMPQGYNMMQMPQNFSNYYPIMHQGTMMQPMMQQQPMNMQNYAQMQQNPCSN